MEQSQNSGEGGRAKLRMWTPTEDKALVESLVILRIEQKYMAQNGFKPGHCTALQQLMAARIPGTDIQPHPHISSRLRALKRVWQAAYDMVFGNNTSGFGWDPDTKFITAEDPVWDEYIKAHPRCAQFRNKKFPHFEELCFVWGKDRAVGDEVVTPHAAIVDIEEEEGQEATFPDVNLSEDIELSHVSTHTQNTRVSKKRKRTHSDIMADTLKETVSSLGSTIKDVFEKIGQHFSDSDRQREKDKLDREREKEEQGALLFEELLALPELTRKERNSAHCLILQNDRLLNAFRRMAPEHRFGWVLDILNP